MNANWKRIYVFAGFAAIAFVGSSFQKDADLPQIVSEANAAELTSGYSALPSSGPNTRVTEIYFEKESTDISRQATDQIANFLRGVSNEGRIKEIKVLVWASSAGDSEAAAIARTRLANLRSLLAPEANLSTYNIFPERNSEDQAQAAILVVLE